MQALALARSMAGGAPLEALLIGPGGGDAAQELGAHGVTTAHVAEDDRLAAYAPAAWACCVTDAIERTQPGSVVAAGTNRGNEVMAHVAARMDLPFAANCTKASEDGTVTTRPMGRQPPRGGTPPGLPLIAVVCAARGSADARSMAPMPRT